MITQKHYGNIDIDDSEIDNILFWQNGKYHVLERENLSKFILELQKIELADLKKLNEVKVIFPQ